MPKQVNGQRAETGQRSVFSFRRTRDKLVPIVVVVLADLATHLAPDRAGGLLSGAVEAKDRFDFNNDGKLSAWELEAAIRHIIQREEQKQEQREDASREAIRDQTHAKRGPDVIASSGDFIDKAFSNRPEDEATDEDQRHDAPAAISTSAQLFPNRAELESSVSG